MFWLNLVCCVMVVESGVLKCVVMILIYILPAFNYTWTLKLANNYLGGPN